MLVPLRRICFARTYSFFSLHRCRYKFTIRFAHARLFSYAMLLLPFSAAISSLSTLSSPLSTLHSLFMMKKSHPRKRHHEAVFIGRRDYIVVPDGATGL